MKVSSSQPLVSIGLPVYNGEKDIRRALDSLLAQDYANLEIVICDNASTDSTPQICAEYAARDARVTLIEHPRNYGAPVNFNRAFELTRGEYFMWAAHDDWLEPGFVSRCLQVLEGDESIAVCYPAWQRIDRDDTPWGRPQRSRSLRSPHRVLRWRHTLRDWPINAVIYGLMRRDMAARTRRITDFLCSDLIFVMDLALQGQIATVPEVLSNKTTPRQNWEKTEHAVLEAHLGFKCDLPVLLRWYVFQHALDGLATAQIPRWQRHLLGLDSALFYISTRYWQHDVKEYLKRRWPWLLKLKLRR